MKARWWQRRCAYRWQFRANPSHIHRCIRAVHGVQPHAHICACGEIDAGKPIPLKGESGSVKP